MISSRLWSLAYRSTHILEVRNWLKLTSFALIDHAQLISDIGGDPSEAQSLIARRAATLAVWCEQEEAVLASGKPLNIGEYATATNTLRRLLLDLGLERRMRDITPRIDAYLAKWATA